MKASSRGSRVGEKLFTFLWLAERDAAAADELPALRAQPIYLYYLPPYSPELNEIEAVFGVIKRHELPERRYTTWETLETAIDEGFTHVEHRLHRRCENQPGLAA